MIIRGVISSVASGANRLAKFVGLLTNYGTRPFMQHWGFFSRPHDGAQGVMVRFGDNMIIIGSDDSRYVVELAQGEVAIGTGPNNKVHIKTDGTILVKSSAKVQVDTPAIELGTTALLKLIDERLVAVYNAHTHPVSGGNTLVPAVLLGDVPPAVAVTTSVTKAA